MNMLLNIEYNSRGSNLAAQLLVYSYIRVSIASKLENMDSTPSMSPVPTAEDERHRAPAVDIGYSEYDRYAPNNEAIVDEIDVL